MDHKTMIQKYVIILLLNIYLTSAGKHSLEYKFTAVSDENGSKEFSMRGLLDEEEFVYYDCNNKQMTPKTGWMQKFGDDQNYWKSETQKQKGCQADFTQSLDNVKQHFRTKERKCTLERVYRCELYDNGIKEGYEKYIYQGEDFLTLRLDTSRSFWTPDDDVNTRQKLVKADAASLRCAYLKNDCIQQLKKFLEYKDADTGSEGLFQRLVGKQDQLPPAGRATHSLQYFYTAVTSGINFPQFTDVSLVDGEPFVYYDSNIRKKIPKNEWIKKIDADDPDYWNRNTQIDQGAEDNFKLNLKIAMERFNQTTGIHTVQRMYGCELHDDGTITGYDQFGYDGEDFISFDLNTLTWIAPTPQAVITKLKLDPNVGLKNNQKNYYENICIDWLKKYVEYGRSSLERKVPPEVSMFQKDSSSPVVCHATGFFPKEVMISWQKNGEDVEEDVEIRETLRNQDGNFQQRSILTVSPEELDTDQYTCVIQHSALEKEMVLKGKDRRVLLPGGGGIGMGGAIIGAVMAVLLLIIIGCVGYFVWKKKSGFKPVSQTSSDGDASSNNSTQKA